MCAAENEEALETILCYQAMGLSISDSPQRIKDNYERLVRKCKTEFNSADPGIKESAREHLIALEKMYETITRSVTYAAAASQQRKMTSDVNRGPNATLRHISCQLTHCPSCSAQISKGLQSCPYCKTSFLTKWQKFRRKYLTVTTVLLFLIAATTISLVLVLAQSNGMG